MVNLKKYIRIINMTNYFKLIFLISITLLVSPSIAEDTQEFNLGIIIPLSGDLAEYGVAIKNGFELAKKDSPQDFTNIKFHYSDSKYDGKTAVTALHELKALNQIQLYYLWGVSPTEAMLPIAESFKLPVIAETTIKEATAGKELVVRAARTGERIGRALVEELEKRGAKEFSMFITEIPFYTDILKHMEIAAKEKGISVRKIISVSTTESDFKTLIWKEKFKKDTFVGAFLLPSQLISFFKNLDQLKLSLQTFNADLIDSTSIIDSSPDTINNTFFSEVGLDDEFRTKYVQEYSSDVHIGQAAQSYDLAMLVAKYFNKLERLPTPLEIISEFKKVKDYQGATGTFSYSESPDAGQELKMPVSLKEIKGKKIFLLE
jgi:branched-chain amino acid transport system substrate-binding protein